MSQEPRPIAWVPLAGAAILTLLVSTVFRPIGGFEVLDLDVPEQIVMNPYVYGLTAENVEHVLTSFCITSYYPVRTLSYALDYEVWGLDFGGFKLTNALIHTVNVLGVFWLVLRLLRHPVVAVRSPKASWAVFAATFSAGVFAVHPVVVEPVTWIAGREELLMTTGALGCIHFHLTARRLEQEGGRRAKVLICYAAAAFFCVLGCLSNAVAAVIPLLIVAWDLVTLARPKLWKIIGGTSVLWVIGGATVALKTLAHDYTPDAGPAIAVSAATEKYERTGEAAVPDVGTFSVDRLRLVLNVYWLNLKTLVWPSRLALCYGPVRPRSLLEREVVLGGIAVGLTCLALWTVRRWKLALVGLVWFALALGPYAQIMRHHIDRADRFLYLPLVGLAVALGAALTPLGNLLRRRAVLSAVVAVGALSLFLFSGLSAEQVQVWRTRLSVWENSVNVSPGSAAAHGLARALAQSGQFERAFEHYTASLDIDGCDTLVLNEFARCLVTCDKDLRDYEAAMKAARWVCELTVWNDPVSLHTLGIVYDSYAVDLKERGHFGQAVDYFNKATEVDPGYPTPVLNLALLLAECSDPRLRRPDDAVRLVDWACRTGTGLSANDWGIVAAVYAQVGRSEAALSAMHQAIRGAEAEENAELGERLRARLKRYQDRIHSEPSVD